MKKIKFFMPFGILSVLHVTIEVARCVILSGRHRDARTSNISNSRNENRHSLSILSPSTLPSPEGNSPV